MYWSITSCGSVLPLPPTQLTRYPYAQRKWSPRWAVVVVELIGNPVHVFEGDLVDFNFCNFHDIFLSQFWVQCCMTPRSRHRNHRVPEPAYSNVYHGRWRVRESKTAVGRR